MMQVSTLESYEHLDPRGNHRTKDTLLINYPKDTHSILTTRINEPKINAGANDLESLSLETMNFCSRFEICSAAKCPLDPLVGIRYEDPADPKCEMAKATRHKYWESMEPGLRSILPFQGYLEAEYNRKKAAKERWESMPEEDKKTVRERMKNVSKHSRT